MSESGLTEASRHVAIAWYGLPSYAARTIREARVRFPNVRFTVISSRTSAPYKGIEELVGQMIHWLPADKPTSWRKIGIEAPGLFLLTSWPHQAYMALAREAKAQRKATIISMVDNYFQNTPKQWGGALYFRLYLRNLFDFMWVPGSRGFRFMRFLGMPPDRIRTGLYSGDPDTFFPPPDDAPRNGIVFAGQFIRRKGVGELRTAALASGSGALRTDLRLIGHGPLENELRASGLKVESFKQAGELSTELRRASALILPSRIDNWGVVAHEAASCGCLVLATRQCACVDDLVEHGVNGYIMERSSIDEIINAANWLDSMSPAQIAKGRKLSIFKAAHFSPKRWAVTLGDFINTRSSGVLSESI